MLLHGADARVDTVEVTYLLWRHRQRAHEAFVADAEEQKCRGASITSFGLGKAQREPAEYEEAVRIWRAGERVRVEHHGGERDGYYAVTDGLLRWMWDERMGAKSNQDDPSVGDSFGNELQVMLNPSRCSVLCAFTRRGTPRSPADPRSQRKALHARKTQATAEPLSSTKSALEPSTTSLRSISSLVCCSP